MVQKHYHSDHRPSRWQVQRWSKQSHVMGRGLCLASAEVDRTMKVVTQPDVVRLSMEYEAGMWKARQPPIKVKQPVVKQPAVVGRWLVYC